MGDEDAMPTVSARKICVRRVAVGSVNEFL